MTVFADAFFWIALLNRRDEYHKPVKRYAQDFRGRLVTTRWILAEVADAAAASKMRQSIRPFFSALTTSETVTVLDATDELFERGLKLYHERPDKMWSLTDCISFVVMRELHLKEALTGDRHFEQAGFRPIFVRITQWCGAIWRSIALRAAHFEFRISNFTFRAVGR